MTTTALTVPGDQVWRQFGVALAIQPLDFGFTPDLLAALHEWSKT